MTCDMYILCICIVFVSFLNIHFLYDILLHTGRSYWDSCYVGGDLTFPVPSLFSLTKTVFQFSMCHRPRALRSGEVRLRLQHQVLRDFKAQSLPWLSNQAPRCQLNSVRSWIHPRVREYWKPISRSKHPFTLRGRPKFTPPTFVHQLSSQFILVQPPEETTWVFTPSVVPADLPSAGSSQTSPMDPSSCLLLCHEIRIPEVPGLWGQPQKKSSNPWFTLSWDPIFRVFKNNQNICRFCSSWELALLWCFTCTSVIISTSFVTIYYHSTLQAMLPFERKTQLLLL